MKPYRTDEFVHKLFYETSRFGAFNNQWVVKAKINSSQRDPTQSSERDMTYQVRKNYVFCDFRENFKLIDCNTKYVCGLRVKCIKIIAISLKHYKLI